MYNNGVLFIKYFYENVKASFLLDDPCENLNSTAGGQISVLSTTKLKYISILQIWFHSGTQNGLLN